MDTLRIKLVIIIFLFVCLQSKAQDQKQIQDVFTSSYQLESEGEYSKAINILKDVYDDESYEMNLRLGWLHYLSGLFIESVPYYEKCVLLKPLSIEARLGLVYPASSMGNWTQVENKYMEILEIDPENSLVNYRMGLIHYGREEYQKAFWYFEKVVNHYPFDYDSVIMLAWTNYRLGKLREAKVLFNKALLIHPGDESALEGLVLIN
jgi:tetratricopeptide (TPR) repeat protein